MVFGLGYLRFAPDADSVSVPAGAQAGDLILEDCDYATENGSYEADCGTLVVPENRADPDSRLIALPVTRIKARSDDPSEPIFRLEGGPGKTNMEFANASRFVDDHDVVLVGYRGVDGSVRLDCPEVVSAPSTPPSSSARSPSAAARHRRRATGLRPEEWAALERRDVDRAAGVVAVRRTVSDGEVVELGKTSASRRQTSGV